MPDMDFLTAWLLWLPKALLVFATGPLPLGVITYLILRRHKNNDAFALTLIVMVGMTLMLLMVWGIITADRLSEEPLP